MGLLGIGTGKELKEFTFIAGIRALNDDMAQVYVNRAEIYISSRFGNLDSTIAGFSEAMAIAIYRTAEVIYSRSSSASYQASMASAFESEKIGSYSYKRNLKGLIADIADSDPEIKVIGEAYSKSSVFISTHRVFRNLAVNDDDPYNHFVDFKDLFDFELDLARLNNIRSGDYWWGFSP